MANTYFQFKQFTVHQDRCAMKVSTEAGILGAWVHTENPKRILDIGAGTGLLALMLAQRFDCAIDAIELDNDTAQQAMENVANSPWPDRINVIRGDVFDFSKKTTERYDLIVTNPPFFDNHLQSEAIDKNRAKHDTTDFDKERFAICLSELLSESGQALVLYPAFESGQFSKYIQDQGLNFNTELEIYNQPQGDLFRIITRVTRFPVSFEEEKLSIRDGNIHTQKFNDLMKVYYLKLKS